VTELFLVDARIRNAIALGESHIREFKSAVEGKPGAKKPRSVAKIAADIREALVAFANADGGELLIGIEDNGEVTGLPHSPSEIETLLGTPRAAVLGTIPLPITTATKVTFDGKLVLLFAVSKGTQCVFQLPDGRCMRRRDLESVPAEFGALEFERNEVRSRESDREFVDGAVSADLDLDLVRTKISSNVSKLSVEAFLQQQGLAEFAGESGLRLRRAALILFGRDVDRFRIGSEIRLLQVAGTEQKTGAHYNVVGDKTLRGNVLELLEKSWEVLSSWIVEHSGLGNDMRFQAHYTYPESSCHEAILNALAHRDYVSQTAIEIRLFTDRLEVRSPGPLLSTVKLADLQTGAGAHESRNVLIARTLRELRYMRELGEGMRRIYDNARSAEVEAPGVYSNGSFFSVTLYRRSLLSEEDREWLSSFGPLAVKERRVLLAGRDGQFLSKGQIQEALQTTVLEEYNRVVKHLREAGFLARIKRKKFVVQHPGRRS
jgi:ATP-dependent DNA helicase RecG